MKVFCPNCGTQNEGMAGGRLTCKACTASFEVPRDGAALPEAAPQVISRPPPVAVAPPPAPFAPSFPAAQAPFPTGYVGPPPTGFGPGGGSGPMNPLAITSLVLGIVCCIPFGSIGAIATGVIARNQIDASNGQQRGKELALAGIILGSLSLAMTMLTILSSLLSR